MARRRQRPAGNSRRKTANGRNSTAGKSKAGNAKTSNPKVGESDGGRVAGANGAAEHGSARTADATGGAPFTGTSPSAQARTGMTFIGKADKQRSRDPRVDGGQTSQLVAPVAAKPKVASEHHNPPRPARGGATKRASSRAEIQQFHCGPLDDVEPQGLNVTYWFEPSDATTSPPSLLHITGQHIGLDRPHQPTDAAPDRTSDRAVGRAVGRTRFDVRGELPALGNGVGAVAFTTRITDLAPGQWRVRVKPATVGRRGGRPTQSLSTAGTTGWAPAIQVIAPGVRLGAWPAAVSLGAVLALITQWLLAAHTQLPTMRLLAVSVIACLIGVAGGKVYYLVQHPDGWKAPLRAGMCIQGFVLAAIGTLIVGTSLAGVAGAAALDVSVPGLMIGMTVGRLGCFFGGCCAGRPTASRWGIWSSDRHVGVRRIPTQLLESAAAGTIAVVAAIAILTGITKPAGLLFIAAIAAYTLVRQLLFPLRAIPRRTPHGRVWALILAASVLCTAATTLAVAAASS